MRPGSHYPLQFFKYPDTPHWRHEAVWLGEDDHGVWLGASKGSVVQRGLEPARRIRQHQVHLVPRDDWWVLTYAPGHRRAAHWIDISTPAEFEEHRVTAVDLDLDIVGMADGAVFVEDEDEFAEHQELLGYPLRLIRNAERAAAEMVIALSGRREPFGATADRWMRCIESLAGGDG